MSILGSTFGRALAGGGKAAAGIASRYVDADIQRQRDEALFDLRHKATVREEEYMQSPEVQGRRTENATTAARTASTTQQGIDLERLNNKPLNEAAREKSAADTKAATEAKTTAEIEAAYRIATDPKATEAQRISAERKLEELKGELGAREASALRVVRGTEEARARFDGGGGGAMKLPPGVAREIASLEKLIEMRDKEIISARAQGMGWAPTTNPDQKALLDERNALSLRRDSLLAPYLGGGNSDPLGLRGGTQAAGEAAPGAAPAAPPTGKPARQPMPTVEEPSLLQRPLSDLPPLWQRAMSNWRQRNAQDPNTAGY